MHVLIIHQAFAALDEPGGTRHYEFARLLAGSGHRVTVIASPVNYITGGISRRGSVPLSVPDPSGGAPRPNLTILRARVYAAHHKSFIHRVIAFVSFMASSFQLGMLVKDVDLVWGTSPPLFQGVTAWSLARLKGAAFLFEVRDLWPLFAVAAGVLRNPVLVWLSEGLERFLYRHADRVIVNSPGFHAHVASRGARRVDIVPNGADPQMFDPQAEGQSLRRSLGIGNQFLAMYAGAHGLSNDLRVVLDAASLLAGLDIHIVMVGDGKEKPSLERYAAQLDLKNLTFRPSVPKKQIPETLAAADACIATLKPLEEYKTTYPNKVFDYMAAGRPVALAIDGVIREVVEAAGCGLFAEPGNPQALAEVLRALSADRQRSREMGLAGRKYLESNFSRAAIGEKLVRFT